MATEGAALSHMRDAYYILTHDLVDVDINNLYANVPQSATIASLQQPNVSPGTDTTSIAIAPIVSKLALTMMRFGTAVDAADDLVKSGQRSTRVMQGVVLLISVIGLSVAAWIIGKLVHGAVLKGLGPGSLFAISNLSLLASRLSSLVSPVGGILIGVTVFVVFMLAWKALLKDRQRQLEGPEQVLRAGFWKMRNNVCGAYAIRFEAAAQQGTMNDFKNGLGDWAIRGSDNQAAPDCGEPSFTGYDEEGNNTLPFDCRTQVNPCSATLPTLETVIANSCPGEISKMLLEFQTLKTNTVDMFDRMAMWKTISTGIDSIRATISVSADADTSTKPLLTSKDVPDVIQFDILPVMKVDALKVLLEATPQTTDTLSKQDTLLKTMESDVLMKVQDRGHIVEIEDHKDDILTALRTYYGTAFASVRIRLIRVINRVQKASDARPPAASKMYVDSATMLARITNMGPSQWQDLVVDMSATKDTVHNFMSNFSPSQTNNGRSLAGDITKCLSAGLTVVGVIGLLMYTNSVLSQASSGAMSKELAARTLIIAVSLFALLVLAVHSTIGRMLSRQGHNTQALVRNGQKLKMSLDATCEISNTIAIKAPYVDPAAVVVYATQHDADVAAIAANDMAAETATNLREKATVASSTLSSADIQNYIDAAIGTVRAYDSCNSITNGARVMPFPMMDLIIYGFVIAVILASALYCLDQLRLREKTFNIRTLTALRDQVMNGVVPPGLVKQLECSTPDASYRTIFLWMAILVLFSFNIYAMCNLRASQQDYDKSLELVDDCV